MLRRVVDAQDTFLPDTARECGTVFLPACSSFEKDGPFMNASGASRAGVAITLLERS